MNEFVLYIASMTYKKYLWSNKNRFWSIVKKLLIRVLDDPSCKLNVHGKSLYLPLSHALPGYLHDFPMYDRLPQRVGTFLRKTYGFVCLIDVGANIGDTLAAIKDEQAKNDTFLGVEPNEHFLQYLILNWGNAGDVEILPCFCIGDERSNHQYQIIENHGTAQIVENSEGIGLPEKTVDQIIVENPRFEKCNFVKIDTDGFDFEVIRGSRKLISDNLPAVLFECQAFSNKTYINDCITSLKSFKQLGYSSFLLYDNFGYLMGIYSLTDLHNFLNLLFYQLTSPFDYFDILLMKEVDIIVFQKLELKHYSSLISNIHLKKEVQSLITI